MGLVEGFCQVDKRIKGFWIERTKKHIVLTAAVRAAQAERWRGHCIEWGQQAFCKRQESKYVPILRNIQYSSSYSALPGWCTSSHSLLGQGEAIFQHNFVFTENWQCAGFALSTVVTYSWSRNFSLSPVSFVSTVLQTHLDFLKLCELTSMFLCYIGGITVSVVAFFFTIKFLFELAARVVSFLQNEDRERRGDRTIYDYVRGNYLDPRSCKVSWDWKDPYEVGHSMAFRVHVRECFCLRTHHGFRVICFPEPSAVWVV